MFAMLSRNKDKDKGAKNAYGICLSQARDSYLYTELGVPDTFDGRFEMLILHAFILMHVAGKENQVFYQNLFDSMFIDIEQTLRERGIGDMGIPKHMRKMMKGFNGRVHSYDESIGNQAAFTNALTKNVYGTCEQVDETAVKKCASYVQMNIEHLKTAPHDNILNSTFTFINKY